LGGERRELRVAARAQRASGLVLAFAVGAVALAGCATSHPSAIQSATPAEPQYAPSPLSNTEQLVAQGASLVVSDGCSACHLPRTGKALGPNFTSFAGHRVTLADGRRVLVGLPFLQAGLEHPESNEIAGYDPAPMLAAIRRTGLSHRPRALAALAAFIEQMGPEGG
jgi:hypothetical protein